MPRTSIVLAAAVTVALLFPAGGGLQTPALAAEHGPRQPPACATAPLDDLKRLCPAPSDTVSEDCLAALERRHAHRPAYCDVDATPRDWSWSRRWWPVPLKELLTWADVFEDVTAARRKVEAAVHDPSCRLRENEFKPKLREPCAADAMTRVAALHRACRRPLDWEDETNAYFDGWPREWAEHRATIEEFGDEDYWRLTASLEESELHFSWRMAKCRAVPKPVLELLPMLRPPQFFPLPAVDQHDLLMVAAARLGNPWAIAMAAGSLDVGHDDIAVELWPDAPRSLAYVAFRFQAGQSSLSFLLAARGEDLHSETPWFDWRGFEQAFSAGEIKAALPAAERIRAEGWPPCCKPQRSDSPWPWAEQPTVVSKQFVRRRIDDDGNVRWVYRDGTETWFKDGVTWQGAPDSEDVTGTYHSRIARATLRRWIDDDGTERWIDEAGDEHWLDADGTEHWIELDGTEWILLPVGKPFPSESAAESQ